MDKKHLEKIAQNFREKYGIFIMVSKVADHFEIQDKGDLKFSYRNTLSIRKEIFPLGEIEKKTQQVFYGIANIFWDSPGISLGGIFNKRDAFCVLRDYLEKRKAFFERCFFSEEEKELEWEWIDTRKFR